MTETYTERERDTCRETHTEKHTHRHIQTYTYRETHTKRHAERHIQRNTHTHTVKVQRNKDIILQKILPQILQKIRRSHKRNSDIQKSDVPILIHNNYIF